MNLSSYRCSSGLPFLSSVTNRKSAFGRLTNPVWFYLRGEEYSAQIDYFVQSIKMRRTDGENSFRSALQADRIVAMIAAESGEPTAVPVPAAQALPRPGWLRRVFG